MQSDDSDIKAGDIVIAVDQYNTSTAPAKITQRIMSSLDWPRVVVRCATSSLRSPLLWLISSRSCYSLIELL